MNRRFVIHGRIIAASITFHPTDKNGNPFTTLRYGTDLTRLSRRTPPALRSLILYGTPKPEDNTYDIYNLLKTIAETKTDHQISLYVQQTEGSSNLTILSKHIPAAERRLRISQNQTASAA